MRAHQAYAIPLRLKYECPAPARFGEDQPLWKTATLHFLQVIRACVAALADLDSSGCSSKARCTLLTCGLPEVDEGAFARVWQRIVAGFQAILQADCRPIVEHSLADQQIDEDFDLAVIATIEMHLLPQVGLPKVPVDAITLLAKALRDASRLYDLAIDDIDGGFDHSSQAMTRMNSIESEEARFLSDYDAQAVADSSDLDLDGTTIGERERPRERFAYWAFDLLFAMCQTQQLGAFTQHS